MCFMFKQKQTIEVSEPEDVTKALQIYLTLSQQSSSKHRNDQDQTKSKLLNYSPNCQIIAGLQPFELFSDVCP